MNNIMLIVDDVEMNRDILRELFRNEYEIMEADSGEEALEILRECQGNIDIVLLDLIMPGLNGFDLLEKRKELDYFNSVPVVVITVSNSKEDLVRAFELGANDFVQKPFVPEIVVSRVNNVMASTRRMLSIELEAQRLRIKSELDEMTNLYNKTTTELVVNEILKTSRNHLDAMMVIDVDHFKSVNDTSGHQAGDHVIKIIADLISSRFRKSDVIGRVGGDEFCVLMVDVPSLEIVHAKADELIRVMRYKPNLALPEYVTLSIGIATNESRETTFPELFKCADEALYQAKLNGRAQYCEYGIAPIDRENDKRPTILLLSNNRSVCSTVTAMAPTQMRVIEMLRFDDLEKLSEDEIAQIALVYGDVSDIFGDAAEFWEKLEKLPWLKMERVFAICQEGSISQYMTALKHGVADLLTVPLEDSAFKRRTMRQLEKLGVLASTEE